jgi:hypothetical protein
MKKSLTITSIILANLLIVVSAAHALPTVSLLKDQLTVSNEVWFGSESEKTESFSYQYNGPSWQGDGFNEVNSHINARIYREIDGETQWAEDLSVASFGYENYGDNSHKFRGNTSAGYFDNSNGWPTEDIIGRGEGSVDLYWRFAIDGEGAVMNAGITLEGSSDYDPSVQTDLILYDETAGLMLFDVTGDSKTGDVELLDSHIYRLWLHSWASDLTGAGDPMSAFEMYFENTEFSVPVPSVALLLVTGFMGLIAFNRKKC